MNKIALTETDIRTKFITSAVVCADDAKWDVMTQVWGDVYFTKGRVIERGKTVRRGEAKKADCILYYKPNLLLAVLEAKDNNRSLGAGMPQALEYAEILDVPSAYISNGDAFLEHERTGSSGVVEREILLSPSASRNSKPSVPGGAPKKMASNPASKTSRLGAFLSDTLKVNGFNLDQKNPHNSDPGPGDVDHLLPEYEKLLGADRCRPRSPQKKTQPCPNRHRVNGLICKHRKHRKHSTLQRCNSSITHFVTIPPTPLYDAHQGGYFFSGPSARKGRFCEQARIHVPAAAGPPESSRAGGS